MLVLKALRAIVELQVALRPRAIFKALAPISEALELARVKKAQSLELRVATSLARLMGRQGRMDKALALPEAVLEHFTEGADLPDQRAARALM